MSTETILARASDENTAAIAIVERVPTPVPALQGDLARPGANQNINELSDAGGIGEPPDRS